LGVRDLFILPNPESVPHIRSLDPRIESYTGSKFDSLLIESQKNLITYGHDVENIAVSTASLARRGAQERTFLGVGFAFIFGVLAFNISRLSRNPGSGF
jgi:hypothetical protein